MSFHRKAFLVWLILMISVGAIAIVGAHLDPVPDEIKRSGMEQLIEAAAAHAKALRNGATVADDHGARAAEEEAE
jgi:hypothetical protein